MIENINLKAFKREYEKFKETNDYEKRKSQTKFIEIAQQTIRELLKKEKIKNEDLTALIQMFGHHCSKDNFKTHLSNLKFSGEAEEQILNKFIEFGEFGYTGRGKAAINNLNDEQLEYVKQFIEEIFKSGSVDQIKSACAKFENKGIPEVKIGVYSPWLYYLRPKFCPIITGPATKFLKKIGWSGLYNDAIDLFQKLKGVINEENLGFIDSFIWEEERRNSILAKQSRATKEIFISIIEAKKQIILYGPPGTGKTYNTKKIAIKLLK